MSDLPALPDDITALLDKARTGAPPPPPGAELAVLAKVTASTTAPLAASLLKPILALALATAAGAAVVVATVHFPAAKPQRDVVAVTSSTPSLPSASLSNIAAPSTHESAPSSALVNPANAAPSTTHAPAASAAANPASSANPASTHASGAANPASSGSVIVPSTHASSATANPANGAATTTGADTAAGGSEEELVEAAREALARGDGERALVKLKEHAARFAHGRLVEERRALTVVAFAAKGDKERAAAAGRAFEREYPSSLFLETVRAAVVTDPPESPK